MSSLVLGGQAVYEGVMLRSQRYFAVAVRKHDGTIAVYSEPLPQRKGFWRLPFLRGMLALYDAIALGLRALRISLDMSLPEEQKKVAKPSAFAGQAIAGLMLAAILFIALPHWMTSPLNLPMKWQISLIEGVARLLMFIAFVWFIGRSEEVQLLFSYHGAEHKAVHAWENKAELTNEGLMPFPPEHSRCGTAFILFVLVVKVILFSFLPVGGWKGVSLRVLMLPIVAGLSFELLKLGSHKTAWRWLAIPGLWLQRLTTRHPEIGQIEVALTALKEILRCENVIANEMETIDKASNK